MMCNAPRSADIGYSKPFPDFRLSISSVKHGQAEVPQAQIGENEKWSAIGR